MAHLVELPVQPSGQTHTALPQMGHNGLQGASVAVLRRVVERQGCSVVAFASAATDPVHVFRHVSGNVEIDNQIHSFNIQTFQGIRKIFTEFIF